MNHQRLSLQDAGPEKLVDVIDGTRMNHRLLPGGELCAEIETLNLASGTLQRGYYGMGVLVQGAWPAGRIAVGVVMDAPAHVTVNGFVCPSRSVQLYSEGCELNYRAPPGSTWFVYLAAREYVQQAAIELSGSRLPIPQGGSLSFRMQHRHGQRIAASIRALFEETALTEADSDRRGSGEQRFLHQIAEGLRQVPPRGRSSDIRNSAQRRELMGRAEDFLYSHVSEPFRLREFAAAVGVSERMLEHHFRVIYGITPHAWFRTMKLNAIRRELLLPSNSGVSISEIATQWGFFHLGRFSLEYRKLFGESPTDTLRA